MLRSFLERRAPENLLVTRVSSPDRFDRAVWHDLSGQLEILGLAVPESAGGSGFGAVEQALVAEELGRALTPVPYFATAALGLPLLLAADDPTDVRDDLAAVLAGETVLSAALAEPGGRAGATPRTRRDGDRLSGHKTLVMDGDLADLLVVSASGSDGTGLFLVDVRSAGVDVHAQRMLDPTRGSAEVVLTDAPATPLVESGRAATVIDEVLSRARVTLAAEQLGGAERCLEIAVDHAGSREQFGRPIGSFQAVKHLCADVLCDLEAARSAAWYAAWAVDESPDQLAMVVPTARYLCSEAYLKAARVCVHVLGGIGFTWEHPAQLFFKRATSTSQLLGSPTDDLRRIAEILLPGPAPRLDTADTVAG